MSRFQATVSTFAAIGTIGLTVVAVYRAVDEQKQRDLRNQEEIQTLRDQLKQQLDQQKSNDPVVPSAPATTAAPPAAELPRSSPPPQASDSTPQPPPPLPPLPGTNE